MLSSEETKTFAMYTRKQNKGGDLGRVCWPLCACSIPRGRREGEKLLLGNLERQSISERQNREQLLISTLTTHSTHDSLLSREQSSFLDRTPLENLIRGTKTESNERKLTNLLFDHRSQSYTSSQFSQSRVPALTPTRTGRHARPSKPPPSVG